MAPHSYPVDFVAAAHRHMYDAKLLEKCGRIANAGCLYGYVAECGLKSMLIWYGVGRDSDGSPSNVGTTKYKVHINQLLDGSRFATLHTFVSGRGGSSLLSLMPDIAHFADWDVAHRYFADTALPASFSNWRTAAHQVGRMLDRARTMGHS